MYTNKMDIIRGSYYQTKEFKVCNKKIKCQYI